jgi:hypothetical protein
LGKLKPQDEIVLSSIQKRLRWESGIAMLRIDSTRPRKAMGLEGISSIALPEHFASFLNDSLRKVPTGTIPVHTHLLSSLTAPLRFESIAYRLSQTHDHAK